MSEWLDKLKVGDEVALCSDYGYADYSLAIIERLTPTQFVIRGNKYRRDSGRRVGESSYARTVMMEATEEVRNTIRKNFLRAKLRQVAWKKINLDVLKQVYQLAKNGQHLQGDTQ